MYMHVSNTFLFYFPMQQDEVLEEEGKLKEEKEKEDKTNQVIMLFHEMHVNCTCTCTSICLTLFHKNQHNYAWTDTKYTCMLNVYCIVFLVSGTSPQLTAQYATHPRGRA